MEMAGSSAGTPEKAVKITACGELPLLEPIVFPTTISKVQLSKRLDLLLSYANGNISLPKNYDIAGVAAEIEIVHEMLAKYYPEEDAPTMVPAGDDAMKK